MEYEESSENIEIDEGIEPAEERGLRDELETPEELEEGDAPTEEIGELEGLKGKTRSSDHHSLEVRRAIEDHLERIRLRKELDYLFDDDFTAESDEDLTKE